MSGCEKSDVCPAFAARARSPLTLAIYICLAIAVGAVGATIDPTTHRQLVRSQIDDPEHLLRSGMFASFVIHVGDPVRSLALPSSGIVREGDGTMTAWVTLDRRRFVRRTVKIGVQQDGWTQILEGLQPDETVVFEGAVFLSNKLLAGGEG